MKKIVAIMALIIGLTACQNTPNASQAVASKNLEKTATYVDAGYANRHLGNDWVMVKITQTDNRLSLAVRSRTDIKKPTCTFDGTAKPIRANHYQIHDDDMVLDIYLQPDKLTISPHRDDDRYRAMYYCSGGGSLVGEYQILE